MRADPFGKFRNVFRSLLEDLYPGGKVAAADLTLAICAMAGKIEGRRKWFS